MFINPDFILNGQAHGQVGQVLQDVRFEPGMMRPFLDSKGRPCVTLNAGKNDDGTPKLKTFLQSDLAARGMASPVANATTLRKEQWIFLDEVIVKAYRARLRAWSDLAATGNTVSGFNGMSKLTYEYEVASDYGEAVVDMDGVTDGRNDRGLFRLRSIPLPITHADFGFTQRQLAVSQNGGMPLDVTGAEQAGRKVAEMLEKTLIGVETGITYGTQSSGVTSHDGTSTVYGYTNFPYRITKTNLTVPTGANPEQTVGDVLSMRNLLTNIKRFGPFMLYHSGDWDFFMDNDYARLGGSNANMTLRDRLRAIDGIQDVRRLDFLNSTYTLIMVQMDPETVRIINGMDITTLQWDTKGGMQRNFKVMTIQVPQVRADYNGVNGIVHATTA